MKDNIKNVIVLAALLYLLVGIVGWLWFPRDNDLYSIIILLNICCLLIYVVLAKIELFWNKAKGLRFFIFSFCFLLLLTEIGYWSFEYSFLDQSNIDWFDFLGPIKIFKAILPIAIFFHCLAEIKENR